MKIQESGENYLETIFLLKEQNEFVRAIDIAEKLNYSKPSISRAMGILKKANLIEIEKSGNILFTVEGLKRAKSTIYRHRIIKNFLKKIGVDELVAENDACRIEHVISETTINKITEFLNNKG